jgi:hypothetical protein
VDVSTVQAFLASCHGKRFSRAWLEINQDLSVYVRQSYRFPGDLCDLTVQPVPCFDVANWIVTTTDLGRTDARRPRIFRQVMSWLRAIEEPCRCAGLSMIYLEMITYPEHVRFYVMLGYRPYRRFSNDDTLDLCLYKRIDTMYAQERTRHGSSDQVRQPEGSSG